MICDSVKKLFVILQVCYNNHIGYSSELGLLKLSDSFSELSQIKSKRVGFNGRMES